MLIYMNVTSLLFCRQLLKEKCYCLIIFLFKKVYFLCKIFIYM
uniref:Uncharacterized protein n=1 Tax=Lophocladia kuetzingii TaxID=675577 RepID=A0A1Z1MNQ9_9FLOR|nr:hypothetical protein [Lophocladia kuetzingii]ARW67733.1 hypothetical protein [Lophocladia kuetzingii]